jgi:hypothetical protein
MAIVEEIGPRPATGARAFSIIARGDFSANLSFRKTI